MRSRRLTRWAGRRACRCLASRSVRRPTGRGACARPLDGRFRTAERAAAAILYDEVPDAGAEARGEVGDVVERLAAVARDEAAAMIILGARSRGRSRTFLRARCAAELAELTNVPVVVAPLQQVGDEPRRGEAAAAELVVTGGDRS